MPANQIPLCQFLARRSTGIGETRIQNRAPLDADAIKDLWNARQREQARLNEERRQGHSRYNLPGVA